MNDLSMNVVSNNESRNTLNRDEEEEKLDATTLIGASGAPITIPTATNVRTRRMMNQGQ